MCYVNSGYQSKQGLEYIYFKAFWFLFKIVDIEVGSLEVSQSELILE